MTARISLNLHPTTRKALQRMVDQEDVTMTEALRRLVSYGDFVYETTQINSADLLVRHNGELERVRLIV